MRRHPVFWKETIFMTRVTVDFTVLYEMDFRLRIRDDQQDCNEQVSLKQVKVTD